MSILLIVQNILNFSLQANMDVATFLPIMKKTLSNIQELVNYLVICANQLHRPQNAGDNAQSMTTPWQNQLTTPEFDQMNPMEPNQTPMTTAEPPRSTLNPMLNANDQSIKSIVNKYMNNTTGYDSIMLQGSEDTTLTKDSVDQVDNLRLSSFASKNLTLLCALWSLLDVIRAFG